GRYHVIARIASGGMGEVLRARDTVLGRIVAVKVLPPSLAARPGFVERFRAEAQAAASLSHPNVVQVHDWGDTGSVSYMVMEHVRGRNLREILASYGRLEPRQACEVVVQALRALGAAHERGLVHRDVKPENVLVTLDGVVKVADFGLARAAPETATTGGLVGTVAYVAPEQVQGGVVDGRTDLYATGCVLYELLTGSQPFEGDPAHVLNEHLHGRVPAPSSEQPEVGEELDRIVARATATAPADRYGSAGQMVADLEKALAALPAAPPVSELTQELTSEVTPEMHETMVPVKRRRRIGRFLLALLVVAALGGLGFLFRPVRVPAVLDMEGGTARHRLILAGLNVELRQVPSNDPRGAVVDITPEAGTVVRHGRKVLVDVSRGPPAPAVVPLLKGLPYDTAIETIRGAGLVLGNVDRRHAPQPEGTVIDQSLPPGDKQAKGTTVALAVSTGPEYVALPDWRGRPLAAVQQALRGLGLTAAPVTEVWNDAAAGTVLTQDPVGVPQIAKGSQLTFTVSKGPEPFQIADYKGQTCVAAKADLESKGIAVTVSDTSNSNAACGPNKVIDQSPPPTALIKKGATVTLYI
ncbi:MAG TPA: PASTA domain-containing protein, partial [Actinomycetota bacterium]